MPAPLASPDPRRLEPGPPWPGLLDLVLEVAATAVTEPDAADVPRRVCGRLARFGGLTGCSVVLFDEAGDAVRTLAASHPEAEQLTRLVHQLGLGIGAEAIRAGRNTVVEDLTRSARTGLAEASQRVGMPVTAVIALRGPERLVGCLQLYGPATDTFTGGLLDQLGPLAQVLGTVLGNIEAYRYSTSLVSQLTTALDRQGPIEQARGLLAERHQVDLDTAYRMLRDQATERGLTVGEVAGSLVQHSWGVAGGDRSVRADAETAGGDQAALPEQRGGSSEVRRSHPAN